MRGGSLAAIRLAESLSTGNVSAVSLTRSLETLIGPTGLGALAIGIGVAVGAFALWMKHTEEQEKRMASLNKEIIATNREIAKLLGVQTSPTEDMIVRITDRIKELQAELNKPNWWERFKGLVNPAITKFFVATGMLGPEFAPPPGKPAVDPRIAAEIEYQKALGILREAQALVQRFGGLTNMGGAPTFGTRGNALPTYAIPPGQGVRPATMIGVGGTPGLSPHGEDLAAIAERRQERIVASWTEGLQVMEESLEDFLVTGKFVFRQLIDDLLRVAFRAAAGDLIPQAVRGVLDIAKHNAQVRAELSKKG